MPCSRRVWFGAKPHCEAFPKIAIADVWKAWADGKRTCIWVNENDLPIGDMQLLDLTGARLHFEYAFYGTPNVEKASGKEIVSVSSYQANDESRLRRLVCPACLQNKGTIFFVCAEWACKQCHDLVHLVQRLTPVLKKVRQRDNLREKLLARSSTSRDSRSLRELVKKLADLEKEVAQGRVKQFPPDLRFLSAARWLPLGEEPLPAPSAGEVGYGWTAGDFGALKCFGVRKPLIESVEAARYREEEERFRSPEFLAMKHRVQSVRPHGVTQSLWDITGDKWQPPED